MTSETDYTPDTAEVRIKYRLASGKGDGDFAEFDRWFQSEIEKAERRGQVLATARRIASENAELMRRLS